MLWEKAVMEVVWKQKISYQQSLDVQESLKHQVKGCKKAFLFGFECLPCVTLGLRGSKDVDLNCSDEECNRQGVDVVSVKRGGQATLHSPGQLVMYPIIDLRQWKLRPRDFLSFLEHITIDVLNGYGVQVRKKEKSAGLFTDIGKIVFFGVHISEGVSQHGLAINVANDLSLFRIIRSCGVKGRVHDSLKNRGVNVALRELCFSWRDTASTYF